MSTSHIQPRRRTHGPSKPFPPHQKGVVVACDQALQKGTTFHSPTSNSSSLDDPVLDISSIPHRSPTCPETLEKLVTASDRRVAELLDSIERSLAGRKLITEEGQGTIQDSLPLPRIILDHVVAATDLSIEQAKGRAVSPTTREKEAADDTATAVSHTHASDSGLGSSVSGSGCDESAPAQASGIEPATSSRSSVYTAIRCTPNGSHDSDEKIPLGEHASSKIRSIVVNPLLAERKFKDYHPIIETIPSRIRGGTISCLRDLEKALIFLAPSRSKSASTYYKFCETSIQYIQTSVQYLNEKDQRRPSDRPYSNTYFVDLIDQVRQYASIMAASRRAAASEDGANQVAYSKDEKIVLHDGLSINGKPAQLVRDRKGETIPIETKRHYPEVESEIAVDDDAVRSMARKRKCDIGKEVWRACRECGKEFKRPCDLTKHEKTHSRPWKCSVETCKYYDLGWPTEKERDRHVNDKHLAAPPLFRCLYDKCAYTSKRESNCKQHMEKAHGWEYKRSKSKKGQVLIPTVHTGRTTPIIATPSSAMPSLSTPRSPFTESPALSSNHAFSPDGSIDTSACIGTDMSDMSGSESLYAVEFGNPSCNTQDKLSKPFESPDYSLETPSSTFSGIPANPALQPAGTDLDFGMGPLSWPPMGEYFPDYDFSAPMQAQQPTPAWSDINTELKHVESDAAPMEFGPPHQEQSAAPPTPGAHEDIHMHDTDQSILPSLYLDQNPDLLFNDNTHHDFQLFGSTDHPGDDDLPNLFSDLGSVGEQFSPVLGQDPMYEAMVEPYSNFEAQQAHGRSGNIS
ncbi:MAG: copper-binding transcription factor [Chrysothrix sp. TS-e1954]|nr:MAG: copper-binding transcription factor [Chrysothrix sp. TS-e1954]